MQNRDIKLNKIIEWAKGNNAIKVVLQTSSLTNPNAPHDHLSDLDIELVIDDLSVFLLNDEWLNTFGKVIAKIVENEEASGGKYAMRMVLYDDFVKVDFRLYGITGFLKEVSKEDLQKDWDKRTSDKLFGANYRMAYCPKA